MQERMVPRKAVHLVYLSLQDMSKQGARMPKGEKSADPKI